MSCARVLVLLLLVMALGACPGHAQNVRRLMLLPAVQLPTVTISVINYATLNLPSLFLLPGVKQNLTSLLANSQNLATVLQLAKVNS